MRARAAMPGLLVLIVVAVLAYLFGAGVISVDVDGERVREGSETVVDKSEKAAEKIADGAREVRDRVASDSPLSPAGEATP